MVTAGPERLGWPALLERLEQDLAWRTRTARPLGGGYLAAWSEAEQRIRRIAVASGFGGRPERAIEDAVAAAMSRLQSPATLRRLRTAGDIEEQVRRLLADPDRHAREMVGSPRRAG
jgi:hypothetical protein